jgi:hypothetical protein
MTEITPENEFCSRVREHSGNPAEIGRFLDGLSHDDRVRAVRGAGRREQAKLYRAVDGFRPVVLSDLVAPSTPAMTPVRHYGKNTLPAFRHFEKRFCRPGDADADEPGELYGFNFQAMSPVTGPGYFVALPNPERADAEVWVDYRRIPPSHAHGWPEIRSNERGLSRFVYGFMVDTLRRVSEHVTIGSAARKGKDLGSWFLLCREAP